MLRIYFEIASSYINIPHPAFLEIFKADLESTFWEAVKPSEWPECQQNADLICVYKDMEYQATKDNKLPFNGNNKTSKLNDVLRDKHVRISER